jgi:hypothetical protein
MLREGLINYKVDSIYINKIRICVSSYDPMRTTTSDKGTEPKKIIEGGKNIALDK